jgi:hypothetical protein
MKTKIGEVAVVLVAGGLVIACGGKSATSGVAGAPAVQPVSSAAEGANAPATSARPVLQSLHWRGKTKNLEVRAVNGPVRAVLGAGDEADVVANVFKSKHGTPLRLNVVEKGGLTLICVASAENDSDEDDDGDGDGDHHEHHMHRGHGDRERIGDDSGECSQHNGLRGTSVELVVQVPRQTKFAGWTVNGTVEAQGLEGEVEAHTQNGAVRIETTGVARASTVNGPIRAKIGAKSWSGTLALESVNGRVEVELPSDIGAELRADTVHGSVRVGPKMDGARVEYNHVEGRLGKGGGELRLRTVNGPIDVR